jgi:3-oxosteroid 1-dehydrogenase
MSNSDNNSISAGWDEIYDFVIVGSGAGAVCAALYAKELGKKPLIIEKRDVFGGSTAFSGGVWWVPNNPYMARDGIEDSYERARQYLDAVVGEYTKGSTPERRERFLKAAPKAIDFLEKYGMKFQRVEYWPDYYDELPGGEKTSRSLVAPLFDLTELGEWSDKVAAPPGEDVPVNTDVLAHVILMARTLKGFRSAVMLGLRQLKDKLTGSKTRGMGRAIQGRLLQIALRENLPIWLDSPVENLITEGGEVVGVKVKRHGKTLRIKAGRGVLLNVGGFSRNLAMRERYQPQPASVKWTNSNPGDTGEMIETTIKLGADIECMEEAWWIVTSIGIDGNTDIETGMRMLHHLDIAKPHCIIVDQDGRRFANEAGSYMEIGQRIYRNHKEGHNSVPCWAILESRNRKRHMWASGLPGKPPKAWIESGYMKQADTLGELAEICGIDPAGLQATVERFNQFAKNGVDEDFGRGSREFDRRNGDPRNKPNPSLGAFERSPFYAVALYPGDIGTSGGLVTNEYSRVLKEDGSPIKGLYATGNTTSSVYGRCYPGAGASISASLAFGYLAAQHACTSQTEKK